MVFEILLLYKFYGRVKYEDGVIGNVDSIVILTYARDQFAATAFFSHSFYPIHDI